jgi:hypothetical protein
MAKSGFFVTTKIKGIPASIAKLRQYKDQAARGAERGVKLATEFLGNESNKVTPKEKGDLRASKETHYTGRGFAIKGSVSYNTPYAIYVHEDLSKYHAPGTYAKFLQRTVHEKQREVTAMIAGSVRASQHE